MEFNLPDAEDCYAEIAPAMGVYEKGITTRQAAEAAVKAVFDFTKKIGHPQKLSEFGVTEENIIKAADMSMSDGSIVNNARLVADSGEVLEIYKKAL
jgi:lactaldehyde reductase